MRDVKTKSTVLDSLQQLEYIPGSCRLRSLNRYHACEGKAKGTLVKLVFDFETKSPVENTCFELGERMWVEITDFKHGVYKGRLPNEPSLIRDLTYGDVVEFRAENVLHVKTKMQCYQS